MIIPHGHPLRCQYPEADDAVNYGNIGATIGHEMTHAFDDEGRQYDGQGNLVDWWTAGDATAFTTRAELMVKQLDRFEPLPGLHVHGRATLGENIADLGGLKIAYDAFQKVRAAGHMVAPGMAATDPGGISG
jgi:predicted metalloendopeptidase